MKTSNEIKKDESLEDAAAEHGNNIGNCIDYDNITESLIAEWGKHDFIAGANWQKEKDKAIQDKLVEALSNIKYDNSFYLLAKDNKETILQLLESLKTS